MITKELKIILNALPDEMEVFDFVAVIDSLNCDLIKAEYNLKNDRLLLLYREGKEGAVRDGIVVDELQRRAGTLSPSCASSAKGVGGTFD